jgi:enoyl-CoA hydratase/carnithine racemase
MSHPDLHPARDAGIATLTIAREARRNAVTPPMWQALTELFATLPSDGSLRCASSAAATTGPSTTGADITAFAHERAESGGRHDAG